MSADENEEINLKILILGDSSVGKTSLLLKYVDGYFPTIYVATIGIEYKIKTIKINDLNINLQIWDTAGQERFRSVTNNFIKGADGIIYVYDITQKSSFDNIKSWITLSEESSEGFKKIILGNKLDLEEDRVIDTEKLKKLCNDRNIEGLEVSAKTGINIEESFETLAKLIIGNKSKEELIKTYTIQTKARGISITSKNKKKKKKCC